MEFVRSRASKSTASKSTACLQSDIILFLVSGFLRGEYALRVFPLICKATKSCRLSLSLLGTKATFGERVDDYEGSMYGIYSIRRDFQRIAVRGHYVNALRVDGGELLEGLNLTTSTSSASSDETRKLTFPCVESICLPNDSLQKPFSFDRFPKLTKIEVHWVGSYTAEAFLDEIWKLPLTSLVINYFFCSCFVAKEHHHQSPAFARTLTSLVTSSDNLLALLSPFCRNLQNLTTKDYHEIVGRNPNLTSLTLEVLTDGGDRIDLSQHTQLTKLSLCGGRRWFSHSMHSRLGSIKLDRCDPDSAAQFAQQCPNITAAQLCSGKWEHLAQIIQSLNPGKCTLHLQFQNDGSYPTLEELDQAVFQRGFAVKNVGFLLSASDANWPQIVKMAPRITRTTGWWGNLDKYLACPADFLTTFEALDFLDISSQMLWDEKMLSSVVTSCPAIKEFKLMGKEYSGDLNLQSPSLWKLNLSFSSPFSAFRLKLPNLTHLILNVPTGGEGIILRGLLDGDPNFHLPRLRVLNMNCEKPIPALQNPMTIPCKQGHGSLTHLTVSGARTAEFTKVMLRNVPQLRTVDFTSLPRPVVVALHLPAECDVSLKCFGQASCYTFKQKGSLNSTSKFLTVLEYDLEAKCWIDKGEGRKRRKVE